MKSFDTENISLASLGERKLREIVKLQYASQQMEAFEKLKSKHNG